MKKMKKILAFVMAMAMVLGMSVTSFAEGTKIEPPTSITGLPSNSDKAKVEITNVNENATITAYRIVEPLYDTKEGFKGYAVPTEKVGEEDQAKVQIADPLSPSSVEVMAIAKDTITLDKLEKNTSFAKGTTVVEGKTNFTAQLGAGYWLVLITGTVQDVYNPMLLGVYYENTDGTGNTLQGESLDSTSSWDLNTNNGYAKTAEPAIDKKIVNGDAKDEDGNTVENANDVGLNGEVNFQIDTIIPSYPTDKYDTVTVKVTDKLSKGLTLNSEDIEVKIDGKVAVKDTDYTVTSAEITQEGSDKGKTKLEVVFQAKNTGIAKNVTITYKATLNDNADYNFDPNTNEATLSYSNDPDNVNSFGEVTDKTYTYTFALGATLTKDNSIPGWTETKEIVKVDEKGNLIVVKSTEIQHPGEDVVEVATGATFTLYKGTETQDNTTKVASETTDEYGKLTFKRLDAGTYTLMETEAPEGFQLDSNTKHIVDISAVYNTDGTLASYTIKIDGTITKEYTATYENGELSGIGGNETQTEMIKIPNTKLSSLPSTGGIGTTIFTIGGCAIMIVAAGLFFASRRKSSK